MSLVTVEMPVQFSGAHKLYPTTPHCTLIFLGDLPARRKGTIEDAVARLRMQVHPQMVPTLGLAVFGRSDHTVIRLSSFVLLSWREFIEKELRRDGIVSASEWGFNPHVTINKHTVSSIPIAPYPDFQTPATVWIDKPVLRWDD